MKPDTQIKNPSLSAGEMAGDVVKTPRTAAENLVQTIKVLAAFVLLGAVIWGLDMWVAGN